MEKVAFLLNGQFVYWRSILLACAVVCALIMAIAARLLQGNGQKLAPMLIAMPIAIVFSVYASRAIHWYCRFESYESLKAALTDFTGGGYSLIGVFVGTLAAFLLVRLLFVTRDLPGLLDAAAPAAALGIAVGRLSDYFSSSDRAKFFLEESLQRIPFSAPAVNATSGVTEWRLATFFAQSAWCTLLFVFLTVRLLLRFRRQPAREAWRTGRVFALFMLLYCLGQIVFDSTRYDALFLRSNGFVSLEQIVCAVVVVALLVLYSVRSILINRFRFWHPLLWVGALAGLGLAGYMEYYVQRHGDLFLFCYGVMSIGLFLFFCMTLIMYRTTTRREQKKPQPAVPPDAATSGFNGNEDDAFSAEESEAEEITV